MNENKRRAPTEEEKRMEKIFDSLNIPAHATAPTVFAIFRSKNEKEMFAWLEENMEDLQKLSETDPIDAYSAIAKKAFELEGVYSD